MANLPGMGSGPGSLGLFKRSYCLVTWKGHQVVSLCVVKRVSEVTQAGGLIVVNTRLQGVDRIFTRELSALEIRIIIQSGFDCDQCHLLLGGLVRFEPGHRFGRIGIGTFRIGTLLNERLDGFFNLMQSGFRHSTSTAIWFEHRLHAWTLRGRTGLN